MSTKELLIALLSGTMPKAETRSEMFKFYNSMVGKSKYFPKKENPKTACGSCIQRVKTSVWKWYHSDETAPNFSELIFTGRLGAHNIPLYKIQDANKKK